MKKLKLVIMILIILSIAGGCGTKDNIQPDTQGNDNINNINTSENETDSTAASQSVFQAEVISAGDSLFIAPDKDSPEYKSSDKMSVNTADAKITDQKGTEITLQELKPGDILEITYNGTILESYPAQVGASEIKVIDHNIIIDAYKAMIDDIYQEDSGLNDSIEMITVDTTGWIELSDLEKEIVLDSMKETYGVEIKTGTFDELAEQGIIDKEKLCFTNGIHITLSNMKYDIDKKTMKYSIQKWRGGDGAIGSDDTTAKYKDGKWNIEKGSMWIS